MGGTSSRPQRVLVIGLAEAGKTAVCESLTEGPSCARPRYMPTTGYRLYDHISSEGELLLVELGGSVHRHWLALLKTERMAAPFDTVMLCVRSSFTPLEMGLSKALLLRITCFLRRRQERPLKLAVVVVQDEHEQPLEAALKEALQWDQLCALFEGRLYMDSLQSPSVDILGLLRWLLKKEDHTE